MLTPMEATRTKVKDNECLVADPLSRVLFATFELVAVLSYGIAVYYIVITTMLLQGYCLIKAIAARRISLMRRRDLLEETGQPLQNSNEEPEDDQLFMTGMFGGLI